MYNDKSTPSEWQQRVIDLDPEVYPYATLQLHWGQATGKTYALSRLAKKLSEKGYTVDVITPSSYHMDSMFLREMGEIHTRLTLTHVRISTRHVRGEDGDYRLPEDKGRVLILDEFQSDCDYSKGAMLAGGFDLVIGSGTGGSVAEDFPVATDYVSTHEAADWAEENKISSLCNNWWVADQRKKSSYPWETKMGIRSILLDT